VEEVSERMQGGGKVGKPTPPLHCYNTSVGPIWYGAEQSLGVGVLLWVTAILGVEAMIESEGVWP
jgi:hypothetical protein